MCHCAGDIIPLETGGRLLVQGWETYLARKREEHPSAAAVKALKRQLSGEEMHSKQKQHFKSAIDG
jgi:hypothetical protein